MEIEINASECSSPVELDRMQRQLDCMTAYSGILQERIMAFSAELEA